MNEALFFGLGVAAGILAGMMLTILTFIVLGMSFAKRDAEQQ